MATIEESNAVLEILQDPAYVKLRKEAELYQQEEAWSKVLFKGDSLSATSMSDNQKFMTWAASHGQINYFAYGSGLNQVTNVYEAFASINTWLSKSQGDEDPPTNVIDTLTGLMSWNKMELFWNLVGDQAPVMKLQLAPIQSLVVNQLANFDAIAGYSISTLGNHARVNIMTSTLSTQKLQQINLLYQQINMKQAEVLNALSKIKNLSMCWNNSSFSSNNMHDSNVEVNQIVKCVKEQSGTSSKGEGTKPVVNGGSVVTTDKHSYDIFEKIMLVVLAIVVLITVYMNYSTTPHPITMADYKLPHFPSRELK